jgi:hypothetical protein
VAAVGLLVWLAVLYPARGEIQVGFGQQRLIQRFDFEERALGNFEALPMYWYPIGRPADNIDPTFLRQPVHQQLARAAGFPSYGEVRFDQTQHTSGDTSFYLGLNGGSVGAYLAVGALPAVPGSDYLITANIRTTALRYARANVVAYFIDSRGQVIEASRAALQVDQTADTWRPVSLKLLGDHPQAAWIGMQLELTQPQNDEQSPLGKHQLVLREVHGGAWFDDIAVWQSPNVTVSTQSPVNLVRAPARPRLQMQVRDLTGRALEAHVAVYDHQLNLVSQTTNVVGDGAPVQWQWTPPLPKLGWYLVDMQVHERGAGNDPAAPVARAISALLWLPDEPAFPVDDRNDFAVSALGLPDSELRLVPQILQATGINRVAMSGWTRQLTRESIDQHQSLLDEVMQPILLGGGQVVLSLSPVPQALARAVDIEDGSMLPMFAGSVQEWSGYLAPLVMRHGQRVSQWQLGAPDKPVSFYLKQLSPLLATAQQAFANLAPDPQLVMAWSLDQARRPDLDPSLTSLLRVPTEMSPISLVQALEPWRAKPAAKVQLRIVPWDADLMDHDRRASDFVQRMVYGWEGGAQGMELASPWTPQASRRVNLVPDPLLGAFSSVAHRLAGRQVVGRLHVADGVECIILNGVAGGAMVAWNRHAPAGDAVLNMYLGPEPVAIDVWGNRIAVPLVQGKHYLELSHMPLFIEGIDPELALFRAAFKVEPRFIESLQVPHQRSVTLYNPWQRTISGHMIVLDPHDWQITPRKHYFSIASGQSSEIPLTLMFPASEVAGIKHLRVRFDFLAHHRYEVDLTTPMELGLRDVSFSATLSQEYDPRTSTRDAVVTQVITNQGKKDLALYAFASMPGFPGQVRIVSQLKPGQSIVRRFRFTGGADALMDAAVRVGLRETDGPAMLNKVLRMSEH